LTIGVCFGLASVIQLTGGRLAAQDTGFKRSLWGSLALILASYLSFVGWFILFPYTGLLGFGGLVLSFFNRTRQPELEME
jgi:dolichol kinase